MAGCVSVQPGAPQDLKAQMQKLKAMTIHQAQRVRFKAMQKPRLNCSSSKFDESAPLLRYLGFVAGVSKQGYV